MNENEFDLSAILTTGNRTPLGTGQTQNRHQVRLLNNS